MDQNFGSCLPKFLSTGKNRNPGGEKETRWWGKKSSIYFVLKEIMDPKNLIKGLIVLLDSFSSHPHISFLPPST
jgi:hypothetical protein